jgi:hypothetical protein
MKIISVERFGHLSRYSLELAVGRDGELVVFVLDTEELDAATGCRQIVWQGTTEQSAVLDSAEWFGCAPRFAKAVDYTRRRLVAFLMS